MSSTRKSYYMIVDGVKVDRELWLAGLRHITETPDSQISNEMFDELVDGRDGIITDTEQATLALLEQKRLEALVSIQAIDMRDIIRLAGIEYHRDTFEKGLLLLAEDWSAEKDSDEILQFVRHCDGKSALCEMKNRTKDLVWKVEGILANQMCTLKPSLLATDDAPQRVEFDWWTKYLTASASERPSVLLSLPAAATSEVGIRALREAVTQHERLTGVTRANAEVLVFAQQLRSENPLGDFLTASDVQKVLDRFGSLEQVALVADTFKCDEAGHMFVCTLLRRGQ